MKTIMSTNLSEDLEDLDSKNLENISDLLI